jgi:hypothetical protein
MKSEGIGRPIESGFFTMVSEVTAGARASMRDGCAAHRPNEKEAV